MPLLRGVRLGMSEWTGAVGDPLYPILLNLWLWLTGDSAFAMRMLSLLLSLLSVALLARLAYVAFGRAASMVAAWIGATSAIWIFYAQEVRQYTLTPLVMLAAVLFVVQIQRSQTINVWHWAALTAAEALALYTHSFMAFGIVALNLWLGLIWLRQARAEKWAWFRVWATSQVAALVLIGPALPNYIARTGAGGSAFVQLDIRFVINAIWNLLLGIPWEHATDPLFVRISAAGVLVSLFVGLAWVRVKRMDADMLYFVFSTMALAVGYWWFTPIIHPRYLLFLSGPLFAVVAVIVVRTWQHIRWLSIVLVGGLALTSVLNLSHLYGARYFGYRHDPVAAVAEVASATSDGIISIDPYDFALRYYGLDEPELFAAGLDEGEHREENLVAFLQGHERVSVIRFHAERSDVRQAIPFYLERSGELVDVQTFESYEIYQYELQHTPAPLRFESVDYVWQEMQLVGHSVEAGNTITVALQWNGQQPTRNYSAVVRVVDKETDWLIAEQGRPIFNTTRLPTSEWATNEETIQYFNVPLPAGVPLIDVQVEVTLLDADSVEAMSLVSEPGQIVTLGNMRLNAVASNGLYEVPQPTLDVNDDVVSGFRLDQEQMFPGGQVNATIEWNVPYDSVVAGAYQVILRQSNGVVGESLSVPLQGRIASRGSPWLDRRQLQVFQDAAAGPADVVIRSGNRDVVVATLEISGIARQFDAPDYELDIGAVFGGIAELEGATIRRVDAGQLIVELVWRAVEQTTTDYTVFVHLVGAEGEQIIAQHDGMPVYGQRPTSSWVTNEYILDEHPISLDSGQDMFVRIGLYDPETFERLTTSAGDDAAILPFE